MLSCTDMSRFLVGTNDALVGDKRGARGGQMIPSWGTNEKLVGDKSQSIVSQSIANMFKGGEEKV